MASKTHPVVSIKQFLLENLNKFENRSELIDLCANKLNVSRKAVVNKLSQVVNECGELAVVKPNDRVLRHSIPANEFKKQHDITVPVKEALDSLGSNVIWDSDFRAEMHIAPDKWKKISQIIDPHQIYRLNIKGKYIWGQPEVLEEIEKTIDIL